MYGYCQEKIEVCHYWNLKGYCCCSFKRLFSLFQVFRYTCSRAWRSDNGEGVNPSIFFFMNFLLCSTKCLKQATHLFVVSLHCVTLYQALRYQVLRKVVKIRRACSFCTSFSQCVHITVLASVICCCFKPCQMYLCK